MDSNSILVTNLKIKKPYGFFYFSLNIVDIIIPIVNTISPNISDGMVTLYLNDFIINNIMLDTNIPNIMLYILLLYFFNKYYNFLMLKYLISSIVLLG